jgi:hypothetical protein
MTNCILNKKAPHSSKYRWQKPPITDHVRHDQTLSAVLDSRLRHRQWRDDLIALTLPLAAHVVHDPPPLLPSSDHSLASGHLLVPFLRGLFPRLGCGEVERLAGLSHICDVALLHALHQLGRREGAEDVEDPLGHLGELVDLQMEKGGGQRGGGWRAEGGGWRMEGAGVCDLKWRKGVDVSRATREEGAGDCHLEGRDD